MELHGMRPGAKEFEVEWIQAQEEGRDVSSLTQKYERLREIPVVPWDDCVSFFEAVQALPFMGDQAEREPSELKAILLERPRVSHDPMPVDRSQYDRRLSGAWLGRIAGCLLGKPVEGWMRNQISRYAELSGQSPLRSYLRRDKTALEAIGKKEGWFFLGEFDAMPEDDDINYTITALEVLKAHGLEFTPADVATYWLAHIPILSTFTAERVAYRNLILQHAPPVSASFVNPFREWIGAQIRADMFGYVAPGDPQMAASLAFKDAVVSHVKNGIYGEMWSAACNAAAFACTSPRDALEAGLSEIPSGSRLAAALRDVLTWNDSGRTLQEAVDSVHSRWDEAHPHGWCHTISNAMLVEIALLWGNMDFAETVGIAVEAGFDTDCNAATAGSILGAILGPTCVPDRFVEPLNGAVTSGLRGFARVEIADLVAQTRTIARLK